MTMTQWEVWEGGTPSLRLRAPDIFAAARRYVDENHPEYRGRFMKTEVFHNPLELRAQVGTLRITVREFKRKETARKRVGARP